MSEVFLSYSHEDRGRAEEVAERLEAAGLTVWWDNELRRGRFTEQIEKELARARCVVVLWSNASGEGDWVAAEADRGRIENKLVQVRLDAGCKVPMPFDRLHILELTDWSAQREDGPFEAVVEAARETAKRSPLLRKIYRARRLWQPKPVSQLRPWDTWLGTMLLLAALATLAVYAWGYFDHQEMALGLSFVFLLWLAWLVVRALIARQLAKRRISWSKALLGGGAVAGLLLLWGLGARAYYAVEPFEEGVKGLYVARFAGDRWNRRQAETVRRLSDHIEGFGVGASVKVKALPRRDPDSEEALRLLARGNALLLMAGRAARVSNDGSAPLAARIVQREGPGFVRGRESLPQPDAFASEVRAGAGAADDLLAAVAWFFAGYAEYLEGEPFDTAADRLGESLRLLRSLTGDDLSLHGGLGVADSFRATAALFLGNCKLRQGKLDEALKLYEEARNVTAAVPGRHFYEALTNIASAHVEAGRFDEAQQTLEEARCRVGGSAPVPWLESLRCAYLHHGLGVTLTLRGRHEAGRARLAEAVELTRQALEAGPAREDVAALEALSHQKWAWSAAKQIEARLVEGGCAEGGCSALLAEAEERLTMAASVWPQGRGFAPFRITGARIEILRGRWREAQKTLAALEAEGAQGGEPEVLLLLAIARMCDDGAEDPGPSLLEFTKSEGVLAGMSYFRYWSNRCPPKGDTS